LIPVPPLDGQPCAAALLSPRVLRMLRYVGMFALMALVFSGGEDPLGQAESFPDGIFNSILLRI